MNVESLVKSKPSIEQFLDIVSLSVSNGDGASDLPSYFEAVSVSLKNDPPPYCTNNYYEIFREASSDGQWLANSLVTNSEREGDGATRLWCLACLAETEKEKTLIKKHAIDESAHSLGYLRLLDLVFPGAVTEEFREELNQLSPHYSNEQEPTLVPGSPYARVPTIDDYIQMNIAEVRTTTHHIMQREALINFCSSENRPKMISVLESLMKDELAHVAYTARLIEEKSVDFGRENTIKLYNQRLRDFNEVTHSELEDRVFD